MEVEGALRIFNRSEVLHNLRYTQYLGDGDSKAYKAVLESKPYKDVNIEKLECVGHVEKRMDTRLRALKLKLKGKKLEDKKSLGGRNRLTDAEIDKLQRYYGLAIRNNSGNLAAMKQAIWAIFFHKISTDLNPQHGLCPLGDDSWSGYNRSKLKGDTYKHKHNLPIAIMHCIKKYLEIFQAQNFCLDVCTIRDFASRGLGRAWRIRFLNKHQKQNPGNSRCAKKPHKRLRDISTSFNTLRCPNTLQKTLSLIDFRFTWTLRPTLTYQGSHLRASQCHPNAAFHRSYPALIATTTALHLSSTYSSGELDGIYMSQENDEIRAFSKSLREMINSRKM
ncbi:uncharacterized protein TNCV_1430391 [Trichonephila clavipes]|nr:uncharacterized protein TNCV_1430391 [Trichonephila clavipes]